MGAIRFTTVIGQDKVIHVPAGVALPQGEIEVTVRPVAEERSAGSDHLASTREWLLALAAAAEKAGPDLPSDMAERHDQYAHGKPQP
jgi:hypothetical protein